MKSCDLGKTGLQIPEVVFGATSLGNLFRRIPDAEKSAIVARWTECTPIPPVIDSAGKYGAGLSLEVIGRELTRLSVPRDSVLISNKLGWRRVPLQGTEPTFEPGAWVGIEHDAVQDISYEGILRCFREGNQLLQGYVPQLVSVHDPDEYLAAANGSEDRARRLDDILSAYRALFDLKSMGEVVAVGVGAKDWKVIQELCGRCKLDWVMFANSLTVMRHPTALMQFVAHLARQGVGIINSALFHGGFLLGGDFFDYHQVNPDGCESDRRLFDWRRRFHDVCTRFSVSPFQVGVSFGLSPNGVNAVALSSSRADRIQSHLDAVAGSVPGELWDALRAEQLIEVEWG